MNSHSRGPWSAYMPKTESIFPTVKDAAGKPILVVGGFGQSKNENAANAQLIAAAPEMLAVLIEISKLIERDANGGQTYDSYVYASGIQTNINTIINKARGK